MNHPYVYIYPLSFGFPSHSGHHRGLSRVSCAIQYVLINYVPGAGERHSTRDKGHEEGGSAYAKAGLSLGSPPRYSRASTPKKPESAYFIALCSHL